MARTYRHTPIRLVTESVEPWELKKFSGGLRKIDQRKPKNRAAAKRKWQRED